MPRDIPIGNGQMLVTFDQHYRVRDLYFPHVGQEDHIASDGCRFGVWTDVPPAQAGTGKVEPKRSAPAHCLCWSDDGWHISQHYRPQTLATDVTLAHDELALELRCCDVVDFHRPVLVRRIELTNRADHERIVHLFHQQNVCMYGTGVGDTAYYDPKLRSLIHYRNKRYIMSCFYIDGDQRVEQYATGTAGFGGAEGTFRDAEDGHLSGNPIAQGSVDSTMMCSVNLPPRGQGVVYLAIGCGYRYEDMQELHHFLHRETPKGVVERTVSYWRLWLGATHADFNVHAHEGLSQQVVDLFGRSLLLVRTQIDESGAIIAANDSDIMQFARDTYSYLWPRDGAYVADAMDAAGFPNIARSFYTLCSKLLTDQGFFLHKYTPDGALASSWHPWVANGRPQLPIQEDETALVLWGLWRHYVRYRDIEFVRSHWISLIQPAADFLARFRDPATGLPLPSYDLWEERWGIHAFTVATVYAGLKAGWQFAVCFGDAARASRYAKAADELRRAFTRYFWSEEHGRFLRRIVPRDHDRTASLMSEVINGGDPTVSGSFTQVFDDAATADQKDSNGKSNGDKTAPDKPIDPAKLAEQFEIDATIDSSMYAIFAMDLVGVEDPKLAATMDAIEQRLWIKTDVGGLARYEDDYYHKVSDDTDNVPGNPWFICTLWLAEYYIATARTPEELGRARPILDWVAERALPSGVLAEQVHPETNDPLSVSPLTWSHATVVSTVVAYMSKFNEMHTCPPCGQPHPSHLPDARLLRRQRVGSDPAARGAECPLPTSDPQP